MAIYKSADKLIGKTPLLELTNIEREQSLKAKIYAKLEYFNPSGSVKDRIAKAMIDDAEASGKLKEGLRYNRTHVGKYGNRTCRRRRGEKIPRDPRNAGNDVCRAQTAHESLRCGDCPDGGR